LSNRTAKTSGTDNNQLKRNLILKIYRGNEPEVGHFGPIIEVEKDETLSQYLQDVVRRHQSSLSVLRHLDFYKNHGIRVTLVFKGLENCIINSL
jgi:hypothetical protein